MLILRLLDDDALHRALRHWRALRRLLDDDLLRTLTVDHNKDDDADTAADADDDRDHDGCARAR